MKKRTLKKLLSFVLSLALVLSLTSCNTQGEEGKNSSTNQNQSQEQAKEFEPTSDFNIRVPFSAGGAVDSIVRIFGQGLQQKYGKTVLVNNLTGANGTIAAADLANSNPDITQLMAGGIFMFTLAPLFNPETSLNLKDYKIVSGLVQEDFILFVNPNKLKTNTWDEFKEYAKSNKIIYGSNAPGGTTHMLATMLFGEEGFDSEAVTSDGSAKDLLAVVSGTCDCTIANSSIGEQYVEEGSLIPLLCFSDDPYTGYKGYEVPTAKSFGQDIVFKSCNFLLTKADVSDEDIETIHNDLVEYSKTEEFKEYAKKISYIPSLDDGKTVETLINNASEMCRKAYEKYYKK